MPIIRADVWGPPTLQGVQWAPKILVVCKVFITLKSRAVPALAFQECSS